MSERTETILGLCVLAGLCLVGVAIGMAFSSIFDDYTFFLAPGIILFAVPLVIIQYHESMKPKEEKEEK